MNLKILFTLLIYYAVFSLFFLFGASSMEGFTSNIALNETDISADELDRGGLFSSGVSFGRFVKFVGFGVGLPDNTPSWFSAMFILWQTIVTIFTIGFLISSIWDG